MIDSNHPAVKAMIGRRLNVGDASDMAADRLNAAIPHLTAYDLRNTPAGRALMAEAWEDGAQAAWGESGEGWNGEYTGRSGPSGVFRAQNPTFPNPYEETPHD